MANPSQPFAQLQPHILVDHQPLRSRRHTEVQPMEIEKARELFDRFDVVIHSEIDLDPARVVSGTLPHNEKGRCLLSSPIASGRLSSSEGRNEPLGQAGTTARLIRLADSVDSRRRDQHVPLHGVTRARSRTSPSETARACKARSLPTAVDHSQLPTPATRVRRSQPLDDLICR